MLIPENVPFPEPSIPAAVFNLLAYFTCWKDKQKKMYVISILKKFSYIHGFIPHDQNLIKKNA